MVLIFLFQWYPLRLVWWFLDRFHEHRWTLEVNLRFVFILRQSWWVFECHSTFFYFAIVWSVDHVVRLMMHQLFISLELFHFFDELLFVFHGCITECEHVGSLTFGRDSISLWLGPSIIWWLQVLLLRRLWVLVVFLTTFNGTDDFFFVFFYNDIVVIIKFLSFTAIIEINWRCLVTLLVSLLHYHFMLWLNNLHHIVEGVEGDLVLTFIVVSSSDCIDILTVGSEPIRFQECLQIIHWYSFLPITELMETCFNLYRTKFDIKVIFNSEFLKCKFTFLVKNCCSNC